MSEVVVIEHPLVQQGLTTLRDHRTRPETFRRVLAEIAALMLYEATRSLETKTTRVRTPLTTTRGCQLKHRLVLVPILRAGLGMLHSILQVVPQAQVGFIGLKRNERTLKATAYHQSLPDQLGESDVVLLDPMLATGGSAGAALRFLTRRGARRIRMLHLIAAPEGIKYVHKRYPHIPIFTAAVDRRLNRRGFILPGLGDAGDRLFGA